MSHRPPTFTLDCLLDSLQHSKEAARRAIRAEDPLFALICEIEAHAAYRVFANDTAMSKLGTIRELAIEAIKQRTGSKLNPLYPQAAFKDGYIREPAE